MVKLRILLAGATGTIGRAVARELVARGHDVTCLVRAANAGLPDGVTVQVGAPETVAGMSFDAVVARGFGPPDMTLALASQLIRTTGRVVISEPPSGDRWTPDLLAELGVHRVLTELPQVAVFERNGFT